MTSSEYIRQHATNIRELLNLRELNDSLAGSIDNDLDIWVEFFTRREIEDAFRKRIVPPSGSKMTVEEVNLFVLEKAIDAREYYLRNETKIDNKRYEEGLDYPAVYEVHYDGPASNYVDPLLEDFFTNDPKYSFNSLGLPTYQETFKTKIDELFIRKGYINATTRLMERTPKHLDTALTWAMKKDARVIVNGVELIAPYYDKLARIRFLLLQRADPNAQIEDDYDGEDDENSFDSLLSSFIYQNDKDLLAEELSVVKLLFDKGMLIGSLFSSFGFLVQEEHYLELIKLLINNGADLNQKVYFKGDSGSLKATPLFFACLAGHLSIMSLLYDNGARFDIIEDKRHGGGFDGKDIFSEIIRTYEDQPNWAEAELHDLIELFSAIASYGGDITNLHGHSHEDGIFVAIIDHIEDSDETQDWMYAVLEVAKEQGLDPAEIYDHHYGDNMTPLVKIVEALIDPHLARSYQLIKENEKMEFLLNLGAEPFMVPKSYLRTLHENAIDDYYNGIDPAETIKKYQKDYQKENKPSNQKPATTETSPTIFNTTGTPSTKVDTSKVDTSKVDTSKVDTSSVNTTGRSSQKVNEAMVVPVAYNASSANRNMTTNGSRMAAIVDYMTPAIVHMIEREKAETGPTTANVIMRGPTIKSAASGPAAAARSTDSIIRDYMRAHGINNSATGALTADVLREVVNSAGIRGWTTITGIDNKRSFIATELVKKGF